MKKERLEQIKKEAHTAGEGDTLVENHLIDSAQLFISNEVVEELTEWEQYRVIEAYRFGFLGLPHTKQEHINALRDVIRYTKENEYTHFEECEEDEQEHHIYKKVLILEDLLKTL